MWVQRNAMRSHDEKISFTELLMNDEDVKGVMSRTDIDNVFDLAVQLRHVDAIFERVFGDSHL